MSKILKGQLFNYSMNSIFVKMATTRLMQQRKIKNTKVDDFVVRKNIINEGDLLLAMFEIEEQSKISGIDLRKK